MHFNERKINITGTLHYVTSFLVALFWMGMILGFEEVEIAITTLICAIIHEVGHILYLTLFTSSRHTLKSVTFGLKIKAERFLSYNEELLLYLCGPLANIIFGAVFLLLSVRFGEYLYSMAIINFATAASNLVPIEGYDGYGILRVLGEKYIPGGVFSIVLSFVSSLLVFVLCVFSIYLIDRFGGGYWIFAVFFVRMIKHFQKSLKHIKNEN